MAEPIIYAIVAGLFVGIASGYMGSLMVTKRMALVGDVLSHVALPGIALGILLNFNPFLGGFAFLFAAVVATWYIERSTRLPLDAVVGVLFVFALAVGLLLTPETDLLEALFGNIADVGWLDTAIAVAISTFIVVVARFIYSSVVLSHISEELAVSAKVRVGRVTFLYLLLVAVVVATGIKVVGTLLVGALVILPAAAAKNVSDSLARYGLLSAVFGMVSAMAGIAAAPVTGLPPGPLVVLAGTVLFIGSVTWRRLVQSPLRRGAERVGSSR